jgi:peroxiredoxin
MISVGDCVPDVQLMIITTDEPVCVQTGALLGQGKVVLFAVPGAFTPVCNDFHLPGFICRLDDLKARGVDTIACVSVNDPYVMSAWGKAAGVNGEIIMLADPNAVFTTAIGMDTDLSEDGLGIRSQRYAAVLQNGRIENLYVEQHITDLTVSTADSILATLSFPGVKT